MKKILLAAIASLALTGSAFAGGLSPAVSDPVVVAPVEVASDWTGFYLGAEAVGQNGDSLNDLDAGVFAGYRYDLGQAVVGAEAGVVFPSNVDEIYSAEVSLGYDAGALLPYVSVGHAWQGSAETTTYGLGADYQLANGVLLGAKYTNTDFNGVNADNVSLRVGFSF